MRRSVKIYQGGEAHLGRRVARSGYQGEAEGYENFSTITICRPGATLEQIKRSLEITIQDIELRISAEPEQPIKQKEQKSNGKQN